MTAICACHGNHQASPTADAASSAGSGKLTPELAKQVLAKIGDREITLGEYAETLERMDPFERLRYQSPDRRKQLLNEMVEVELLAEEAKRRGLDKQPETQERLRQMLKEELLNDVRKSVPGPNDVPESEVHAYYDAHHDEFKEPERRRVAHIVMANEAQAKAVLDKARTASPSEWGKLVAENSLDKPEKSAGPAPAELAGDLGIVGPPGHPRGANPRVPEALRAAVFQIDKVGDVLDHLVPDSGKFQIVRMTSKSDARDRSFQDAERTIRVAIAQEHIRTRETQLETELRQRFPVTIDDQALSQVKVPEPASGGSATPAASAR
ncbi:MAG TPA: peptidyl-prolyl cis-trans isomerase [Polyangiaceae bacterium]